MNLFLKIIFPVSLVILFSCNNNKEKKPIEYEQEVMAEIFPSLIDSIWVEINFSMRPPPIREIYDSNTRRTSFEPIANDSSVKSGIIEDLNNNKKAGRQMTIVVIDTIRRVDEENVIELKRHFQSVIIGDTTGLNDTGYKIDFTKCKTDPAYILVYDSEFKPKEHDPSREYILSKISFSRMLFDKDKMFGILTCEYDCGTQCGNGYRVFIKKINDKWVIDKIEESWIA